MHVFFAFTFTGKKKQTNQQQHNISFFQESQNKRPLHKIAQSLTNAGN